MPNTLRLRLLGKARVFDGSTWLEAPLDKRFALLAYLACAEDWVDRGALAFLFWPDTSDARAKRNLRNIIFRTKALPFASGLQTIAGALRWQVDSDVHRFHHAVLREDWEKAAELHGGELLQGLNLDDSPEFTAWLELERKRLRESWRRVAAQRAARLEQCGLHQQAAELAKSLSDSDELDEEALQTFVRNAFLGGRREAALAAYHGFARKLQQEFGLEPLPATQELINSLRRGTGEIAAPTPSDGAPHTPRRAPRKQLGSFPAENTSFVGREREVAEIIDAVTRPECRLLTLVGPGGIGKTRLALRAASTLVAHYSDGAVFLPLASVEDSGLLPGTIASALSLPFYGQVEPMRQLLDFLRHKQMLLVLDNLEHLLDGAELIARILDECRQVNILATSRARLSLSSERLERVEGLSLPGSEPSALSEGFDAIELFLRRARRVRGDFVLDDTNRRAVISICRSVGGAPLGIELAAAWVQLLSCEEIAEVIERDMSALHSPLRDVPERHRSLRAVFEHTWKLLSPTERAAFSRLAVFQGGFDREAAERIALVTMRSLLSLLDKSLIKRGADGRFSVHELLRQFAAEKLADSPEEERAARSRHARYYANFLHQREPPIIGGERQRAALLEIDAEIDNVRAAWQQAVRCRDLEVIDLAMECLCYYYLHRDRCHEGELFFRMAADTMSEEDGTRAKLLAGQGMFASHLSRLELAEDLARSSLATLERLGQTPDLWALESYARAPHERGEWELSEERYLAMLSAARALGSPWRAAEALLWLADNANLNYAYERGKAYASESLALHRELGNRVGLSRAMFLRAYALHGLGELAAAEAGFLEGIANARQVDVTLDVVRGHFGLAELCLDLGQRDRAYALLLDGLAIVEERERIGHSNPTHAHMLLRLGRAMVQFSKYPEAVAHLRAAFSLALKYDHYRRVREVLVSSAEVMSRLGDESGALGLLAFVLNQGGSEIHMRKKAQALFAEVASSMPAEVVAEIGTRGKALEMAEIAGMLEEFERRIAADSSER